jgi:hypothetical protein
MANTNYSDQGFIARSLSKLQAVLSGNSDSRGKRKTIYSEDYVANPWGGEMAMADEGSLMMSTMAPGATTLQLGLSATFSATAACLVFKNNAPQNSGVRCHLRDIRFWVVTPPTSGTCLLYATVIDNGGNRAPTTVSNGTGGTGPGTPATATAYLSPVVCTNADENPTIYGQWWFPLSTSAGAPPAVPAATSGARTLEGNGILRGQIPVGSAAGASDDYRIVFGATDRVSGQLVTAAPAGASRIVEPHPAVSVGPQEYFLFYLWSLSNATAGIAFGGLSASHVER